MIQGAFLFFVLPYQIQIHTRYKICLGYPGMLTREFGVCTSLQFTWFPSWMRLVLQAMSRAGSRQTFFRGSLKTTEPHPWEKLHYKETTVHPVSLQEHMVVITSQQRTLYQSCFQ